MGNPLIQPSLITNHSSIHAFVFLAAEVRGQIHQPPDPIIPRRINMPRINISTQARKQSRLLRENRLQRALQRAILPSLFIYHVPLNNAAIGSPLFSLSLEKEKNFIESYSLYLYHLLDENICIRSFVRKTWTTRKSKFHESKNK